LAVIDANRLRGLARDLAPWIAAALGIQIGLHALWPAQYASAVSDREHARRLRSVVPDARILQRRIDSLRTDSVLLGERLQRAKSRQLSGSDPAALLASRIVPLLGQHGWKLDKVKAEAAGGLAILDLGATATFASTLEGLRAVRRVPLSIKIRRLSLRPNPSGRLSVDLQIAVPNREAP
jgi:hypothetical protein